LSRQVADHVQEISSVSQQISAGSEQVAASLGGMSETVHHYAEQTRQLSSMTHDQLSLMDGIFQAAQLLHVSSRELESIMEKIKEE
jgi:methyl-accepting chemotaxis protein